MNHVIKEQFYKVGRSGLIGIAFDWGSKCWRSHCVVSLSKTLYLLPSTGSSADPEGGTGGSDLPWKITSYMGFYSE